MYVAGRYFPSRWKRWTCAFVDLFTLLVNVKTQNTNAIIKAHATMSPQAVCTAPIPSITSFNSVQTLIWENSVPQTGGHWVRWRIRCLVSFSSPHRAGSPRCLSAPAPFLPVVLPCRCTGQCWRQPCAAYRRWCGCINSPRRRPVQRSSRNSS